MTLLIEFIQYIHSKGTFWPRNKLILQNKISVKPNTSVEFKFLYGSKEVMTGKREKCIQVLGIVFFLKRVESSFRTQVTCGMSVS